MESPQGVLARNFHLADVEYTPLAEVGVGPPRPGLVPNHRHATAGGISGQIGELNNFQPGFGQLVLVYDADPALQVFADLAPAGDAGQLQFHASQIQPRPSQSDGSQQQQGIEEPEEKSESGSEGVKGYDKK